MLVLQRHRPLLTFLYHKLCILRRRFASNNHTTRQLHIYHQRHRHPRPRPLRLLLLLLIQPRLMHIRTIRPRLVYRRLNLNLTYSKRRVRRRPRVIIKLAV